MKSHQFLFASLTVAAVITAPALAQVADTKVQVPVGPWVEAIAPTAGTLLLAAVMWALRKLPDSVLSIIKTAQVDQMLTKAIDYGINRVKGASKDKVLEVDVGSAVLAEAVSYVNRNGPKWMGDWLGGAQGIGERVIARLDLSSEAGVDPKIINRGGSGIL